MGRRQRHAECSNADATPAARAAGDTGSLQRRLWQVRHVASRHGVPDTAQSNNELAPAKRRTPGKSADFGERPRTTSWSWGCVVSGQVRHPLNQRGNRKLNWALHVVSISQLGRPALGQAFYDRKPAEGKTSKEAIRALKRRISDVVYRHLVTDAPQQS